MESQKPIKLPQKTSSNNEFSKKETIRKNPKEIKTEKPIISISINHDSIVLEWNFKKLKIFLI